MKLNQVVRVIKVVLLALMVVTAMPQSVGQCSAAPSHNSSGAGHEWLQFSKDAVLVYYVGGTLPENQEDRHRLFGQYGCLEATEDGKSLVFKPYARQAKPRRVAGFGTHLVNPSWRKGNGQCDEATVKLTIPFDEIQVLARGQVVIMGNRTQEDSQLIYAIGTLAAAAVINTRLA